MLMNITKVNITANFFLKKNTQLDIIPILEPLVTHVLTKH